MGTSWQGFDLNVAIDVTTIGLVTRPLTAPHKRVKHAKIFKII